MANSVRITYYGMDGEGRTVTEAKQDAGRKIEQALKGDHFPLLVRIHDRDGETLEQALVCRALAEWHYTLLNHRWDSDTYRFANLQSIGNSGSGSDKYEVAHHALTHMAQLCLHHDMTDDEAAFIIEQAPKAAREDLWRNLRFQRTYRAWTATGADSMTAHHWASWWGGGVYPPVEMAVA